MKMSDLMLLSACQDFQSTVGLIDRRGGRNLLFKSQNNRNWKAESSTSTQAAQSSQLVIVTIEMLLFMLFMDLRPIISVTLFRRTHPPAHFYFHSSSLDIFHQPRSNLKTMRDMAFCYNDPPPRL